MIQFDTNVLAQVRAYGYDICNDYVALDYVTMLKKSKLKIPYKLTQVSYM